MSWKSVYRIMRKPNRKVARSPLSDSDLELLKMPSIAAQMPVRFSNGAYWGRITGYCSDCGKEIPTASFTGRVTQPMESLATVEAVGFCKPCRLVTRFYYRLHDDMRITGPTEKGWATWQAKSSIFYRLGRFVLRAFRAQERN